MARRLKDQEALIVAHLTYTVISVNAEEALDGLHAGIALIEETDRMRELLPLFYQGVGAWLQSSGRYGEAGGVPLRGTARGAVPAGIGSEELGDSYST